MELYVHYGSILEFQLPFWREHVVAYNINQTALPIQGGRHLAYLLSTHIDTTQNMQHQTSLTALRPIFSPLSPLFSSEPTYDKPSLLLPPPTCLPACYIATITKIT